MTDREIFQTNLTNLMKKSKVKQVDIAKYAEVSYKTVSAWVKGRGYPRVDTMEKLCKFFNVTQSALTVSNEKPEEEELLTAYRAVSDEGKQKLLERARELITLYPKKGNNEL